MDAKTFLRQVILCDKHINSKLEQIAQLRALATKITSDWKEDVVSGCGLQDKISSAVAKIVDLEEELNDDIDKFVGRKKAISLIIERVQDPDQVDILYRRYFKFETLEQIACELHMSYRNVCYIHGRALQTVNEILKNEGESFHYISLFFSKFHSIAHSSCDIIKMQIQDIAIFHGCFPLMFLAGAAGTPNCRRSAPVAQQ